MVRELRLSRRAAMLLPLAAAGCETLDDWLGEKKTPLPGTRIAVMAPARGLRIDNPPGRPVTVPPPAEDVAWMQAGGMPAHAPGNLALGLRLAPAWSAEIGAGGGYWEKLTATPVAGGGRVFAMDSDAVVSAFDGRSGGRLWRTETALPDDDSTNIGGGIALDGNTLYVATGRADLLALDAATGKPRWRQKLSAAARAAPTIAEGRLFVPTLDEQLLALATTDGGKQWSFQSPETPTSMLGLPSPAYADGLVVAGFGSGDLVCLRADSGAVTWTDGLASSHGRASLLDFSAIHGLPVIDQGQVYAVGLGGLLVALDLRSGRRLWEREIASEQTPWLAGDWLFVVTPDQVLGAVNRTDGTVAWTAQLPQFENPKDKENPITWYGPVLGGGRLLLAGSGRALLEVNPATGATLATRDLPAPAALPPVVAGRTVFVVLDDGTLLALR
jgi:outer membrane protein assembly factor BamB